MTPNYSGWFHRHIEFTPAGADNKAHKQQDAPPSGSLKTPLGDHKVNSFPLIRNYSWLSTKFFNWSPSFLQNYFKKKYNYQGFVPYTYEVKDPKNPEKTKSSTTYYLDARQLQNLLHPDQPINDTTPINTGDLSQKLQEWVKTNQAITQVAAGPLKHVAADATGVAAAAASGKAAKPSETYLDDIKAEWEANVEASNAGGNSKKLINANKQLLIQVINNRQNVSNFDLHLFVKDRGIKPDGWMMEQDDVINALQLRNLSVEQLYSDDILPNPIVKPADPSLQSASSAVGFVPHVLKPGHSQAPPAGAPTVPIGQPQAQPAKASQGVGAPPQQVAAASGQTIPPATFKDAEELSRSFVEFLKERGMPDWRTPVKVTVDNKEYCVYARDLGNQELDHKKYAICVIPASEFLSGTSSEKIAFSIEEKQVKVFYNDKPVEWNVFKDFSPLLNKIRAEMATGTARFSLHHVRMNHREWQTIQNILQGPHKENLQTILDHLERPQSTKQTFTKELQRLKALLLSYNQSGSIDEEINKWIQDIVEEQLAFIYEDPNHDHAIALADFVKTHPHHPLKTFISIVSSQVRSSKFNLSFSTAQKLLNLLIKDLNKKVDITETTERYIKAYQPKPQDDEDDGQPAPLSAKAAAPAAQAPKPATPQPSPGLQSASSGVGFVPNKLKPPLDASEKFELLFPNHSQFQARKNDPEIQNILALLDSFFKNDDILKESLNVLSQCLNGDFSLITLMEKTLQVLDSDPRFKNVLVDNNQHTAIHYILTNMLNGNETQIAQLQSIIDCMDDVPNEKKNLSDKFLKCLVNPTDENLALLAKEAWLLNGRSEADLPFVMPKQSPQAKSATAQSAPSPAKASNEGTSPIPADELQQVKLLLARAPSLKEKTVAGGKLTEIQSILTIYQQGIPKSVLTPKDNISLQRAMQLILKTINQVSDPKRQEQLLSNLGVAVRGNSIQTRNRIHAMKKQLQTDEVNAVGYMVKLPQEQMQPVPPLTQQEVQDLQNLLSSHFHQKSHTPQTIIDICTEGRKGIPNNENNALKCSTRNILSRIMQDPPDIQKKQLRLLETCVTGSPQNALKLVTRMERTLKLLDLQPGFKATYIGEKWIEHGGAALTVHQSILQAAITGMPEVQRAGEPTTGLSIEENKDFIRRFRFLLDNIDQDMTDDWKRNMLNYIAASMQANCKQAQQNVIDLSTDWNYDPAHEGLPPKQEVAKAAAPAAVDPNLPPEFAKLEKAKTYYGENPQTIEAIYKNCEIKGKSPLGNQRWFEVKESIGGAISIAYDVFNELKGKCVLGTMIAANSGLPGGALTYELGHVNEGHLSYKTQEEAVWAAPILTMCGDDPVKQRLFHKATIEGAWGMSTLKSKALDTIQKIIFRRAKPKDYNQCYVVKGCEVANIGPDKKLIQAQRFSSHFFFADGPNANINAGSSEESTTFRTYNERAATPKEAKVAAARAKAEQKGIVFTPAMADRARYDFFYECVKTKLRATLDAMAAEGVTHPLIAQLSCGLYAPRDPNDPGRPLRTVNAEYENILQEVLSEKVGPNGEARGLYFAEVILPKIIIPQKK